MATYTKTGSINSHYTLKLIVTETDVNQANNTSKVNWTAQLVSSGGWSFSTIGATVTVKINGVTVYNKYAQRSISANGTLTIASGTTSAITHNADGSKSVACSLKWDQNSTSSYTPGDCTASGTLALTTIPRYPTSSISSIAKDINSVTIYSTYSVATPTQVQVYNGDTLVGTYISSLTAINIQGLSPNTTYNFKVRGYANGGWGNFSNIVAVTTYDYARFTSCPNITIGNNATVSYSNPSGATISVGLYKTDNSTVIASYRTATGTSYTFNFTSTEITNMYNTVPSALSINLRYYIKTVQNGVTYYHYIDKTFTIDSNTNKPTFSDFNFADVDATTLALTGDSSKFIQGYSTARISVTTAQKAVAKNSATITKYRITIGSTQQEVNFSSSSTVYKDFTSVSNAVITVSAIDSRGLQTTVTKTAGWVVYTKVSYSNPVLLRENGVGTKVFFDFSGLYKVVNFGAVQNKFVSLHYRFKEKTSETWSSWIALHDNNTTSEYNKCTVNTSTGAVTDNGTNNFLTTGFNNTEQEFVVGTEYNIQFAFDDKLTGIWSEAAPILTLSSGIPCTSKRKNGELYEVGINCFPEAGVDLKVLNTVKSALFLGMLQGGLKSVDSRYDDYAPNERPAGLYVDFKDNDTDGLSDGGSYHGVLTFRTYGSGNDLSGGKVWQIGFTENGNIYKRQSTSTTTWGSWSLI